MTPFVREYLFNLQANIQVNEKLLLPYLVTILPVYYLKCNNFVKTLNNMIHFLVMLPCISISGN